LFGVLPKITFNAGHSDDVRMSLVGFQSLSESAAVSALKLAFFTTSVTRSLALKAPQAI